MRICLIVWFFLFAAECSADDQAVIERLAQEQSHPCPRRKSQDIGFVRVFEQGGGLAELSILSGAAERPPLGEEESLPSQGEGLQRIQQLDLPNSGRLCCSSNGLVFVKVDDEYVHRGIEAIREEGFVEPPYFGGRYNEGAHISAIYPEEWSPYFLQELGRVVSFHIKGYAVWDTPDWEGVEKVWVLLVECPELEALRQKYGFSDRFQFHITIGIRELTCKQG